MSDYAEEIKNPYLHMSKKQLIRRYRKIDRNIQKILSGRNVNLNYDLNRVALITISQALHKKQETDMLNELIAFDTFEELPEPLPEV